MRGRLSGLGLLIIGIVSLGLGAIVQNSQAQEEVKFRLNFQFSGEHAPYFAALEQGYFAAEGLRVTLAEGQGSGTTIKLVDGGRETFGYADYGTMMKGMAEGISVKAIFGILQKSPICVIALRESAVRTPRDLVGRSLALNPAGATYQILPAVLTANGVEVANVRLVTGSPLGHFALLVQKKVDAIAAFCHHAPPLIEDKHGVQIQFFYYADWGANTLSNGLLAGREVLNQKPELVRRFLRAVAKGWEYALRKPQEAVAGIVKGRPALQGNEGIYRKQFGLTKDLLYTPASANKPLGWMARTDWEKTQDLLVRYAGLKGQRDVTEYYTNEYIPGGQ